MESLNNPQFEKLQECHSRLFGLLDSTRKRVLAYLPAANSVGAPEHQTEVAVLTDLATLLSLATEFCSLLRRVRPVSSSSKLQNHPADLAVTTERKIYEDWADVLDARGVEIWNHSSQVRRLLDNQRSSKPGQNQRNKLYNQSLNILRQRNMNVLPNVKRPRLSEALPSEKIHASMRQLAVVLIHGGSPTETSVTAALRLINISTKASKAHLEVYDLGTAMKNVETALQYEDELLKMFPSLEVLAEKEPTFAHMMLEHYSVKADCSWASGNDTGTLFNLRKALEILAKCSKWLEANDSMELISRLYAFSYTMLKPSTETQEATSSKGEKQRVLLKVCEWLTIALSALDSHGLQTAIETQENMHRSAAWELKFKIIKTLAYAYSEAGSCEGNDSEELRRKGEQALEEALAMKPSQQMWLMKIQSLTRRGSFGPDLGSALAAVLETSPFSELLISRLMSVAHRIPEDSHRRQIFGRIFLACLLRKKKEERNLGDASFYAIVLNSISSRQKSGKPAFESGPFNLPQAERTQEEKLRFLQETSDAAIINNSEFRLASDSALMSQTLIWHHADQEYERMKFDIAAKWYGFGTHAVFKEVEAVTFTKLSRKAALSWVNYGNYDLARKCLRMLPSHGYKEAGTHFISFMIDTAQGNEAEAIQAINRIMSSLDFKPETLLYAARQADQRGLKDLLYHILQKILEATSDELGNRVIEGLDLVVLLRSLIRIDLAKINSDQRDRMGDAQKTLQHYRTARQMMILAQDGGEFQISAKDATWFWKTAFNNCISATNDWPGNLVFDFFGITADLISLARKIPASLDEVQTLVQHEIHCRFACLAGRFNEALSTDVGDHNREDLKRSLLASIMDLKNLCNSAFEVRGTYAEKFDMIRSCLSVWEFESYSLGKDWNAIEAYMKELELNRNSPHLTTRVLESIADIACHNSGLPEKLLITVIQHVLLLIEQKDGMSVSIYSRWIRLVVDLELSIGRDEEAANYVNMALQLKQQQRDEYPSDEATWLLAKSWDRSIDLYHSQNIRHSKLWCELALKWMELVVGGRAYEDMMNRHYRDILKLTENLDGHDKLLSE